MIIRIIFIVITSLYLSGCVGSIFSSRVSDTDYSVLKKHSRLLKPIENSSQSVTVNPPGEALVILNGQFLLLFSLSSDVLTRNVLSI